MCANEAEQTSRERIAMSVNDNNGGLPLLDEKCSGAGVKRRKSITLPATAPKADQVSRSARLKRLFLDVFQYAL